MNHLLLRSVLRQMVQDEQRKQQEKPDTKSPYVLEIGSVEYKTPEQSGVFPIYMIIPEQEGQPWSSPFSFVRLVSGEEQIHVTVDGLYDTIASDMLDIFSASIAHEIGHKLAGHMELDSYQRFIRNTVDKRTERQMRLADPETEKAYIVSANAAVLAGGVLGMELEADLIAVKFVGPVPVIAIHVFDNGKHQNLAVEIEKWNRRRRLIDLAIAGEIKRDMSYELTITLNSKVTELIQGTQ